MICGLVVTRRLTIPSNNNEKVGSSNITCGPGLYAGDEDNPARTQMLANLLEASFSTARATRGTVARWSQACPEDN